MSIKGTTSCALGHPVVEVNNLRKTFRSFYDRPSSLKEALVRTVRLRLWQRGEVTALDGITLNVHSGERLAIIGPNGSGKTTLLAALSGVLQPTEGTIKVHGRAAPLLGVGSGFHPELTGEENVRFVGSALGMPLKEIRMKLPALVAFAEVEGFMNAPIRTYSTGMVMRLGFSLGVHANPDLFFIDEHVHSTDESFQQKALTKLHSFADKNKTILFVSHDPRWTQQLATRVVWIENGRIKADGETAEILESYKEYRSAAAGRADDGP